MTIKALDNSRMEIWTIPLHENPKHQRYWLKQKEHRMMRKGEAADRHSGAETSTSHCCTLTEFSLPLAFRKLVITTFLNCHWKLIKVPLKLPSFSHFWLFFSPEWYFPKINTANHDQSQQLPICQKERPSSVPSHMAFLQTPKNLSISFVLKDSQDHLLPPPFNIPAHWLRAPLFPPASPMLVLSLHLILLLKCLTQVLGQTLRGKVSHLQLA